MNRSIAPSLFVLVVFCGFALPAAAQQMPISGTGEGDGTFISTGPGMFHQTFDLEGEDTQLGSFTGESSSDFTILSGTEGPQFLISNAMFTETFADGTLFGTGDGTGTLVAPNAGTFEISYVFAGGTGAFAGFTGEIMATGMFVRTSPTTTSATLSYTGFLVVPEPGSLALLAGSGLVGMRLLRRRRK